MIERSRWPIVVGGCHRSGTSLVRRMLDAHTRIHCGPEVPFLRDFHGAYRADPLARLRFASAARSILPEDELLDVLGAAFVEIHERAAAAAGKARWADKAPENILYAADWERLLGDRWLLVHVVRNPLDTLASMVEHPFRLTLPPDLDGRIEAWLAFTEAGLAFGDAHPARYRRVVYEQLTGDPTSILAGLIEWLGERLEPVQLDFNAIDHQTGLEDPKIARTDAVHRDSVGRWKAAFSEQEAARIWRLSEAVWRRIDGGLEHVDPPIARR